MTPEEWNEAARNEADHVEDAAWAGEARRYGARVGRWKWIWVLLAAEAFVLIYSLNQVEYNRQVAFNSMPDWSTWAAASTILAYLVLIALVLSRLRLHAVLIGLFVALFPLFVWLTGLVWPPPPDPFPGSYLHVQDFFPRLTLNEAFYPSIWTAGWTGLRFTLGWLFGWLGWTLWRRVDRRGRHATR